VTRKIKKTYSPNRIKEEIKGKGIPITSREGP
jgi:hypothetical protein